MGHEKFLRGLMLSCDGGARRWAIAAVSRNHESSRRRGADLCSAAAEHAFPGSPHERIVEDLLCERLRAVPDERSCEHAAACGNVRLLVYLRQKRGTPWDARRVARRAVFDGSDVACLKYVCSDGISPCDATSLCVEAAATQDVRPDVLRVLLRHAASTSSLPGPEAYAAVNSFGFYSEEKLDALYDAGVPWGAGANVTESLTLAWASGKDLSICAFPATLKKNKFEWYFDLFSEALHPFNLPTSKNRRKNKREEPRRGQLRRAIRDRGCVLAQAVCLLGSENVVVRHYPSTEVKVEAIRRLRALRVVAEAAARVTHRRKHRAASVIQSAWLAYAYAPSPHRRAFAEAQSRWRLAVTEDDHEDRRTR